METPAKAGQGRLAKEGGLLSRILHAGGIIEYDAKSPPPFLILTSPWQPLLDNIRNAPLRNVIIESPFAGDTENNLKYARAAALDCVRRGENPFASHLFYTQFLDDNSPEQRELGIKMGFERWQQADEIIFYVDLGMSPGMKEALARALMEDKPFQKRYLRDLANEGKTQVTERTRAGEVGTAAVDEAVAKYAGSEQKLVG